MKIRRNKLKAKAGEGAAIAHDLEKLDSKLWAVLTENGCVLAHDSPFSALPRQDLNMTGCPVDTRPAMREIWELLQLVRRVRNKNIFPTS